MMLKKSKDNTFKIKAIVTGVLILAVLSISLYIFPTKQSIRIHGWILQFLGMGLAIKGLLDIRRVFKESDFFETLMTAILFAIIGRKDGNATGSLSDITLTPVKIKKEQWSPDDPKLSFEKRLESALKNIARLKEEQDLHNQNLKDLAKELKEHKTNVSKDFITTKEYFESFLKSLHINGIMWALVGIVWLTVGLTLSTLAPELAPHECGKLFCTIHPRQW